MKHPIILILLLAASLTACRKSGNSEQAALSPADDMKLRLTELCESGKTLLGHHDDPVYGHSWCGDSGRSDILEITGDYPAMMSWDLGGLELGRAENLDSVPFARIVDETRRQHLRGGFNTFSWHLFSPVDSTDCWNIGDSLTVKKILNDSVVNATFRAQLRTLAGFFNSLDDGQGNRIPVIFRPFHEHTGHWFWWGKPYATPGEYTSLWKIMADEFEKAGVDNLLYAYSTDRVASEEEYLEYYPCDDLIDILGIDIYHFNGVDGTADFCAKLDTTLPIITELSARRGKIAALTETGSEGIPIADWWTETLLPRLKKYHPAYVVLWRNAHDKPTHFYVPFKSHSSEKSFKEFCNDSTILLIKDLK